MINYFIDVFDMMKLLICEIFLRMVIEEKFELYFVVMRISN